MGFRRATPPLMDGEPERKVIIGRQRISACCQKWATPNGAAHKRRAVVAVECKIVVIEREIKLRRYQLLMLHIHGAAADRALIVIILQI